MKSKRINKYKKNFINSFVYHPYYHKKIDDNLIFIDSMNGEQLSSDVFRIIEELSDDKYKNFRVCIYAKKGVGHIEKLRENYNLRIDKIISDDVKATNVCEYAKYIITDSKIRYRYAKRNGQVILNVYHENPSLKWGVDNIGNYSRLASQQAPFLLSDYTVISSDYVREKIMGPLMIEDIYQGKILSEGNPRNISFFRDNSNLKSELGVDDKDVFVYMPRYQGKSFHKKFLKTVKNNLKEFDKGLKDNQTLFFKVDGYAKKSIDLSKFKHIRPFPLGYDDYDIISMADAFITDYSGVVLDFILSKRKIILFNNFDKKKSTYLDDLNLPFVRADDIEDVIGELDSNLDEDYSALIDEYAPFESADCAKNICSHVFLNQKVCPEENNKNDKPNILIFIGNLSNNEITLSLRQLLSQVDSDKYNFIVTFHQWSKHFKNDPESVLKSIPEGIHVMPMKTKTRPTYLERKSYAKFLNSDKKCSNSIRKFFKREFRHQFYGMSFDHVVNYDGYYKNEILMFCNCEAKSSMWVHNDPLMEIENKKFNVNLLKEAFSNYDNVVAVSSELMDPIRKIDDSANVKVAHSLINFDFIRNESQKDIMLNKDVRIYNTHPQYLKGLLNDDGKKIISIDRSIYNEEWTENILMAFDKLCDEYDDVQLIIIGNFGWFNRTQYLASQLRHWKNVTVIKQLSNPLPILKDCALFILPPNNRFYRKTVFESEMLNVPVMSLGDDDKVIADEFNVYNVENSYEGVLKGLQDFMNDEIDTLDIDYKEYNERCLDEFYDILK